MKNNEFEFEELKDKGSTLSVHTGDPIAIKEMQKSLNEWGYTDAWGRKLSEDGVFGTNTFNSVIKYQEDNGLVPDGIVGDKTWKYMSDKKKAEKKDYETSVLPKKTSGNPREHGAFATIDKAFNNSIARGKENKDTEDDFTDTEDDFESLKDKGSVLSVHSGSPEAIKAVQKELNSMGYTDAFGRKLSEDGVYGKNTFNSVIKFQMDNGLVPDGIVGDKTWKAISDKRKKEDTFWFEEEKTGRNKTYNGNNAEVSFLPEKYLSTANVPETEDLYFMNSEKGETKTEKSSTTNKEETGIIKPGYNENGEWSEDPDADNYGKDSAKYKLLTVFDKAWKEATPIDKKFVSGIAYNLRNFDESSICHVYYMNNSDGGGSFGHTGILLVNENGEGILFSYGAATKDYFDGPARMNIGIYRGAGLDKMIADGENGMVISNSGKVLKENYNRWQGYDVSAESGISMFEKAVEITANMRNYDLLSNNCDQVVIDILNEGGVEYESKIIPNKTFDDKMKGK